MERQLSTSVLPQGVLVIGTLFLNFMSCFGQDMHLCLKGFTEMYKCFVHVLGKMTFKGNITAFQKKSESVSLGLFRAWDQTVTLCRDQCWG